eukprot:TRINITY_DN27414_c0_g2_i1.p1 TRINITY_DN27414_c0_g2~~TRINITY_DN27414_c0_g2_i1.p1  ORF type:complete len:243 (+),score=30.19 TRINITY_DN27414_c0_g2_i1:57-785(+)
MRAPTLDGGCVGPLKRVVDTASYEALLHIPSNRSDASGQLPLLVYLHGAGESGTNIADIISDGATGTPPVELYYGRAPTALADRFVVVAPQTSCGWDGERVVKLVDYLIADGPGLGLDVDRRRVYVTGHSMGGGGALRAAATGRFAAAVPVAGTERRAPPGVPIWAFHGKNDRCVPSSITEQAISELRRAGSSDESVRLTLYDEAPTPPGYPHAVGHASTIPAYATLELYDWLLSHQLKTAC